MKFLAATLLLISSTAFAEKLVLPVDGVHCGGCTSAIEGKVCKDNNYVTCKAEVLDEKNKKGQLIVETKPGQKINLEKIASEVKSTSYVPKTKEAKITN